MRKVLCALVLSLAGCAGTLEADLTTKIGDALSLVDAVGDCAKLFAASVVAGDVETPERIAASIALAACINGKVTEYVTAHPGSDTEPGVVAARKTADEIKGKADWELLKASVKQAPEPAAAPPPKPTSKLDTSVLPNPYAIAK